MWPESFQKCGVIQVRAYFNGIQIVFAAQRKFERGLYVAEDSTFSPDEGSGIEFRKLAGGIYWFREKRREAFVPGLRP
jgi:hypothetical protein